VKSHVVHGILVCMALLLTTSSPAAETTKVLHFAVDQCLGRLSVEDPFLGSEALETGRDLSFPFGFDPERVCLSGDWDFIGSAQGEVVVPADRNLQLVVVLRPAQADMSKLSTLSRDYLSDRVAEDPQDLSGLSMLGPNDLYGLRVSSLIRRRDAGKAILEPISRLTGLQILALCETGVTEEQIGQLKSLRSLRALELSREFSLGNAGLAALEELPVLQYLDLDTGATDVGFKHLARLQTLRWLRLRTGRTWGPGLAELAKLPRLERLCLWGTTGISDRQVGYLEGLTRLKSLTLWGGNTALTDATLASIGKLTSLEELYFTRIRTNFTTAGLAQLKDLKRLRRIQSQERISDAQVLATLPQLEFIRPVDFTGDNMKALRGLPHLKSVGICLIPSTGGPTCEAASHLGALKSLEELTFCMAYRGGHLVDEEVACLESLANLKKMHIDGRDLTDRSLISIGKLRQLESLNFYGSVTKRGLNQLNGLTNLRALSVTRYSEGVGGIDETPVNLSALTDLRTLTLNGFHLQDSDLAFLAGLRDLEWLTLQGGPPSEGALIYLKDLTRLKHLDVSNLTCTTGSGLAWLAGLKAVSSMTLRGRITDAALRQLPALPSLWGLTVETDEIIRPETVALLRQRLPAIQGIEIRAPRQFDRQIMEVRGTPGRRASPSFRGRRPSVPRNQRRRR